MTDDFFALLGQDGLEVQKISTFCSFGDLIQQILSTHIEMRNANVQSYELWHWSAKWNFTFFAFENSEREEKKKSICMLVETRIHLTLTELRSLDFAIPLLYMTFTHRASDSERVEGKKKSGGWWGRRSNKKWLTTEGGWIFNKWGQKKCQWVVKLNSLPRHFSNLVSFFSRKIIAE